MSSKIFEEALADAKKLREVAEDNAKKVILEAVTPKIREFIEGQLLEDNSDLNLDEFEDMHPADDLDEDIMLDESSLNSLIKMLGGENLLENSSNKPANVLSESVKTAISSLNSRQRRKLVEISNKINKNVDILSSRRINNKDANKRITNMGQEKYYEVDLKALRESIEEEMDLDSDLEEDLRIDIDVDDEEEDELAALLAGADMDTSWMDEDEDLEGEEDEDLDDLEGELPDLDMEMPPGDMDMGDEEDFQGFGEEPPEDLEEAVYHVDPNMLREELTRLRRIMGQRNRGRGRGRRRLREGSSDDQWGGKGSSKAGVKNAFGGSGKKNAGYKGAFGGGSYGSDAFTNPPALNKLNEALRKQRRANRALNEKLNKYRGAVKTLREQLEELNLFNAKLLYVNKLLQNKGLTESQKKSVIKALDEAKSLTEAKSLYRSLTETFTRGTKKSLNESRHLGSSSRTTTSSSARRHVNNELDRWQTLAGLK